MIKRKSVDFVKYGAHALAQKTMYWNEPISEFNARYPNVLESCVNVPFQKYGGKDLYKSLEAKAAILFYLFIKNHPFQNGNKRVAITTLLLFLLINKKWLSVNETVLYNTAVWVAQSPPDAKDEVVSFIARFVRKYLVDEKEK